MPRLIFNGDNLTNGNKVFSYIPPQISSWFLPSKDELNAMYTNLHDHITPLGGFVSAYYWSSSEFDNINVWRQWFGSGLQLNSSKYNSSRVRAVRTITTGVDQYSLREVGPSGGFIFHIDGTTYYESAPADIIGTFAWSNITEVAVTGTNTSIGTGLANTLAIVDQDGHTTSAAQKCLDYVV